MEQCSESKIKLLRVNFDGSECVLTSESILILSEASRTAFRWVLKSMEYFSKFFNPFITPLGKGSFGTLTSV